MKQPAKVTSQQSQRGMTLLELMVALGVGAILTYGIVTLLRNTGKEAASLGARADYTGLVNEMQQVFNNPERCRAAFKAPNSIVPSLDTLGLPGAATTVPLPITLNTGNTDPAKGPLGVPYAAGAKWGNSLTIKNFDLIGKKPLGDKSATQWNVLLQVVASRRIGQDKAGSETAAGGDLLRKTFNLVVALEGGKVVGCAGQTKTLWVSTGTNGLDIIYKDGGVGVFNSETPPMAGVMLDVDGTTQAEAFQYRSDSRLKENVREIPGVLDRVLRLHGVLFDWKNVDGSTKQRDHLGFLAQEVEAIFPEAVFTDPETGMKSIAYEQLVGPMIEAIKERQKVLLQQQRDLAEIRKAVQAQ